MEKIVNFVEALLYVATLVSFGVALVVILVMFIIATIKLFLSIK